MVGHWVRADCHPRTGEISNQALFICHAKERRDGPFMLICYWLQQWAGHASGAFGLPERVATMRVAIQRIQRPHLRQHYQLIFAQLRYASREIIDSTECS